MTDELDPTPARLLEQDDDRPDLIGVTLESLHQNLGNQSPHNVHDDGHKNSAIEQEKSVEQLQPTKQELQEELNKQFANTIHLLEPWRSVGSHMSKVLWMCCVRQILVQIGQDESSRMQRQ